MSTALDELEEGEITDSGDEQKPQEKPAAQQYCLFSQPARNPSSLPSFPRKPCSDSDSSQSEDSEDDNSDSNDKSQKKKMRLRSNNIKVCPSGEKFVNPNCVGKGGEMPTLPKPSNRTIWSSVLQEQLLTSQMGGFSMDKKVESDRSVEAYDFTRAKEDDRPFPVEDEMNKGVEDDLFGETVDFEKSVLKQNRNLKRNHKAMNDRLGRRPARRKDGDLPPVTVNSSAEEVTYYVSHQLEEKKVHLIRRVVKILGQETALEYLKKTEEVEASGGLLVMNGTRRRTKGGVYLTLLKKNEDGAFSKEQLDEVFEEETYWVQQQKQRKKARARRRKQLQRQENKEGVSDGGKAEGGGDGGKGADSMEVAEEGNTRSSMEGQTGSPPSSPDHLSDTAGRCSDEGEDGEAEDRPRARPASEDFATHLKREIKRQAQTNKPGEDNDGGGDADADADVVTLDDVLDINVDDDFLD